MNESPRALVIDNDPSMLRYLAEALSTFRPGFHVTTATDLGKAARWLSTMHPDLIVVRLSAFESAELGSWLKLNRVDRSRILGISPKMKSSLDFTAVVVEPVILSQLLNAARSISDNGHESERQHDPSTDSAHAAKTRQAS